MGLHILRVGSWLEHSIVSTHKKEPSQSCSSERVLFVLTCPYRDCQATCKRSRQLHLPKQREKMTEVHSCGSPPFSTCLGAVASFIISQGQKCHKKPFPLVYYQSHKEKSVKGGHRPQRLPLILFFVGYNAGGENGCPSVSLLPPVLHCPFRRKKVKGGLRPFFICCTR